MDFETSLLASDGSPLISNAMMSNTSPLEVLSNAAALIEKSKTCDELHTKLSNSIKELPTKENKLKRNKDRRELAYSHSFKLKARCSSPIRDESMLYERGEHSLSPNFSPGPHTASSPPQHLLFTHYSRSAATTAADEPTHNATNNAHSFATTYTGVSQRPSDGLLSAYRGSPYGHIESTKNSMIIRRNSDAMSQHSMTTQSSSAGSPPIPDDDDDQPLDFSSKTMHRQMDTESQSNLSPQPMVLSRSPPTNNFGGQQMQRPSVIMCSGSASKTQQHLATGGPPPPPPSYADSVSPTHKYQTYYTSDHTPNGDDNTQRRHNSGGAGRHQRRQIVTTSCEGVSDPVIEEHFRRSLGKEYTQLFANSTNGSNTNNPTNNNPITYSVDDHFAKALGDTWIRLQKTESSPPNNAQSIAS